MTGKIKQYCSILYGTIILILSALLFRQKRRTESAESQLSKALVASHIKEIDHAIQEQTDLSSDAVANFRKRDK